MLCFVYCQFSARVCCSCYSVRCFQPILSLWCAHCYNSLPWCVVVRTLFSQSRYSLHIVCSSKPILCLLCTHCVPCTHGGAILHVMCVLFSQFFVYCAHSGAILHYSSRNVCSVQLILCLLYAHCVPCTHSAAILHVMCVLFSQFFVYCAHSGAILHIMCVLSSQFSLYCAHIVFPARTSVLFFAHCVDFSASQFSHYCALIVFPIVHALWSLHAQWAPNCAQFAYNWVPNGMHIDGIYASPISCVHIGSIVCTIAYNWAHIGNNYAHM